MNEARATHLEGKLRHELYIGRHHLVADVRAEQGGEDMGPSPHDYLAAALASCTAITLRMYAQRKNWPLSNAEVVVSLAHEGDATTFRRTIGLTGDLSPEQRMRLLEIANHCPVHKTLAGRIEIDTKLT